MDERVVYVNGELVPESRATVSIFDRGFLSGIGVFEKTRTFRHVPFRLDEHLRRLDGSLRATRLDTGLPLGELKERTMEVLRQNLPLLKEGEDYSIAHYVSQGPAGEPTLVIYCQPLALPPIARLYRTGAHVVTTPVSQSPIGVVDPKMKTTSRMHLHLATVAAKQVDPEAYPLILDSSGNVCELNAANFWIVRDGVAITPPGRSCLRGITRDAVLEIAPGARVRAVEADFQVYDVVTADEAFLTGTTPSILPVTRVDGATIGDGRPGPVTARLQSAFAELVGVDFVAQALAAIGG
jgi:branched-chain amino acid aminotransferase